MISSASCNKYGRVSFSKTTKISRALASSAGNLLCFLTEKEWAPLLLCFPHSQSLREDLQSLENFIIAYLFQIAREKIM